MLAERDIVLVQVVGSFVLAVAAMLMISRDVNSVAARNAKQIWLSTQPAKRWAELFFLQYSAVWIAWFGVVVISGVWEHFGPWSYMAVGLAMAVPCVMGPYWLEPTELRVGPLASRYWLKANAWIAIFSYVGNYFWTHYFYTLLGASYTLKAHRINDVPIAMFLMTHAYFCTYHTATTACLRRWWTSRTCSSVPPYQASLGTAAIVLVLAYITALTEGLTIQGFPYYAIKDREYFYTVGSFVYGLYFVVSFPMYARLDEWMETGPSSSITEVSGAGRVARRKSITSVAATSRASISLASPPWTLSAFCLDALAASMLVTILLDLWRLTYAWIVKGQVAEGMLPWVPN